MDINGLSTEYLVVQRKEYQDTGMAPTRFSSGKIIQLSLIILLVLANLSLTILLIIDASHTRSAGQMPEYWLSFPEYLNNHELMPEGHYGQLAVVAAPYIISFLMPLSILATAFVIARRRRLEHQSNPWTKIFILVGVLFFAANATCAYMIWNWTPTF